MVAVYLLQGNVGLSVLHGSHEAPAFAFGLQLLATLFEVCIQRRQLFPEVVYRAFKVTVRNEEQLFDILLFYLIASFTC